MENIIELGGIHMKILKKWWFWVLVVIIVGAIGSNMQDTESTPANANEPKTSEPEVVKEQPKEEPKKDDSRTITKVGGSTKTKNFIVTVEDTRKLKGNDFNRPADGKEFVEVVLLIENISDKDYSVSSLLMFDAYVDGFTINESIGAQIASDDLGTMDGALAAGKKIRGALAYELPIDWEELEINIDLTMLSFSNDGMVKIILNNN